MNDLYREDRKEWKIKKKKTKKNKEKQRITHFKQNRNEMLKKSTLIIERSRTSEGDGCLFLCFEREL